MRAWTLAVVLVALTAGSASAQDIVRTKIEAAVRDTLAPELKAKSIQSVSFESFVSASTNKPALAGAGLSQLLAEYLAAQEVGVSVGQSAVISGTITSITDHLSKPPAPAEKVVIKLAVGQKPVCEVTILLLMEATILVNPVDVAIPPSHTSAERVAVLTDARKTPPPAPKPGETVKWSPDETIGLELLVARRDKVEEKSTGKPLPEDVAGLQFRPRAFDKGGRVPAADGEVVRFRLTNKNSFPVAGRLLIDGIEWSAFATTPADTPTTLKAKKEPTPLMVMIPANDSVVVRGWYRDPDHSFTFDMKYLPSSAVGRQADAGVVAFMYSACWKKGEKPAPGEESSDSRLANYEIGRGGVQKDAFELTERVIGKIRGAVTAEYGGAK
jgi:hypothetical protein